MHQLTIFIDGSVNPTTGIGYGAYLAAAQAGLSVDELRARVKVRRFAQTSSTKLELQTLVWALSEVKTLGRKVIIYTDSQNIIKLPGRRDRLERQNYRSGKNTLLKNSQLYREFYRLMDLLEFKLVKVQGHLQTKDKDEIDRLFTLVDRASRKALRDEIT